MKLVQIGTNIFYPVTPEYLLLICTEETLKELTIVEIRQLVEAVLKQARGEHGVVQ